jgi:hypothetical protein
MRSLLGMAAAAMAGLAASVATDADRAIVPFFIGLAVLGGIEAAAAQPPFTGQRRLVARGAALLWILAAVWVGVLLLLYNTVWEHVGPPPVPEPTYLGVGATAYHLIGLYGGVVLVLVSAFGPARWFERSRSAQRS